MPYRVSLIAMSSILFACNSNSTSQEVEKNNEIEVVEERNTYEEKILTYQKELGEAFINPETSPLQGELLENFKNSPGHDFYGVNEVYRVQASWTITEGEGVIKIPTSDDRTKEFKPYGVAKFTLMGEKQELILYQNIRLLEESGHENHLFLPFKDLTSGETSYGGGRYIDLEIPTGDTIEIDFNKAYNPYCAYSDGYSCPIPPAENHLNLKVEAGIKSPK